MIVLQPCNLATLRFVSVSIYVAHMVYDHLLKKNIWNCQYVSRQDDNIHFVLFHNVIRTVLASSAGRSNVSTKQTVLVYYNLHYIKFTTTTTTTTTLRTTRTATTAATTTTKPPSTTTMITATNKQQQKQTVCLPFSSVQ